MRILVATLGTLLFLASFSPAEAICPTSRIFSTYYGGNFGYVYTPGCGYNGCGSFPSSVTDDFTGSFWAMGHGDPAPGPGIDNGTLLPLPYPPGWFYVYPFYPGYINGTWAQDPGIDGCIDFATGQRCMMILLTDVTPVGETAVALLTEAPGPIANYDFTQPGNSPINLVTLDPPVVISSTPAPGPSVDVTLTGAGSGDLSPGLYLDPACPDAIAGLQWHFKSLPQGSAPPTDTTVGTGGWTLTGSLTALGSPANLNLSCAGGPDLYVTYAVITDSGFGGDRVALPTLVQCSSPPTCGNGVLDPGEECDDGNNIDGDGCEADCSNPPAVPGLTGFGLAVLVGLLTLGLLAMLPFRRSRSA